MEPRASERRAPPTVRGLRAAHDALAWLWEGGRAWQPTPPSGVGPRPCIGNGFAAMGTVIREVCVDQLVDVVQLHRTVRGPGSSS